MSFDYRFEVPSVDELEEMGRSECPYTEKCNKWDCEDCKYEGSENMNEYVKQSIALNEDIEKEFAPLEWVDITVYEDEGTGSISFTGPRINSEEGETCKSESFRKREDAFFTKMRGIKKLIHCHNMTADLIKFYADNECPYSEATININFEGGEL